MKYSFLPIYYYVLEVGYIHYLFSLVPINDAVDVKLIKRIKVVKKKSNFPISLMRVRYNAYRKSTEIEYIKGSNGMYLQKAMQNVKFCLHQHIKPYNPICQVLFTFLIFFKLFKL